MISNYLIHLGIIFSVYALLGISLLLSMGYTGILNLAHISFYAVGSYTTALLSISGVPLSISLLLGGVCAMFSGFLISLPTIKLRDDYMALATIAFSYLIYSLLVNLRGVTNGVLGISGIPRPTLLSQTVGNAAFLVISLLLLAVFLLVVIKLVKSPFGDLLKAIKNNENAVKILGFNTFAIKTKVLILSALLAGLAGGLYASYSSYINPHNFSLLQIIPILTIIILAGMESPTNTIIASSFVVLTPEIIRLIGLPPASLGPLRQVLYTLFLTSLLYNNPVGFFKKDER